MNYGDVSNSPEICPANSEQTCEEYVLGRLSPAAMADFHLHIETCAACADLLAETFEFVEAFQEVAAGDPETADYRDPVGAES